MSDPGETLKNGEFAVSNHKFQMLCGADTSTNVYFGGRTPHGFPLTRDEYDAIGRMYREMLLRLGARVSPHVIEHFTTQAHMFKVWGSIAKWQLQSNLRITYPPKWGEIGVIPLTPRLLTIGTDPDTRGFDDSNPIEAAVTKGVDYYLFGQRSEQHNSPDYYRAPEGVFAVIAQGGIVEIGAPGIGSFQGFQILSEQSHQYSAITYPPVLSSEPILWGKPDELYDVPCPTAAQIPLWNDSGTAVMLHPAKTGTVQLGLVGVAFATWEALQRLGMA